MEAVVEIFKDIGCEISIGDSPAFGKNIKELYEKTGVTEIAKKYNIKEVVLQREGIIKLKVNNILVPQVYISNIVFESDLVISLPKWKTHNMTILTAAVKNSYGLLPGVQKGNYHKVFPDPTKFSDFLVDLYIAYHPDLFIVDGIAAMDGEGPAGGRIMERNLIAGSTDAMALDSILIEIMGIDQDKIDFLKIGKDKNAGKVDLTEIEIIGVDYKKFQTGDYLIPSIEKVRIAARVLPKFLVNLVNFYPEINRNKCIKCGKCIEICPVKVISKVYYKSKTRNTRECHCASSRARSSLRPEKFKEAVPPQEIKYIKINHKTCIGCLCCKEVCPVDAIDVKFSWFFRTLKKIKDIFIKPFKR